MNPITDILSQKMNDIFSDVDTTTFQHSNTPTLKHSDTQTPKHPNTTTLEETALQAIREKIVRMKEELDTVLRLLGNDMTGLASHMQPEAPLGDMGERIVEGIFTGEKVRGEDGTLYNIPPNYASKSKLVEGDTMKLTITKSGSFIYKLIVPVVRKRAIGTISHDATTSMWHVLADGRTYTVLPASVTFYKGRPGDEVIVLIARDAECSWGAVDNIIHR